MQWDETGLGQVRYPILISVEKNSFSSHIQI